MTVKSKFIRIHKNNVFDARFVALQEPTTGNKGTCEMFCYQLKSICGSRHWLNLRLYR